MANNTRVQKLILDKNDLHGQSLVSFMQMFTGINHLKYISLQHCNLKDLGTKILMDGLEKNTSLEHLNLHDNQFGKPAAYRIAAILGNPLSALKFVDLSNNRLEEEGGVKIAESLTGNNNLCKLVLRDTDIKDETARALVMALKACRVQHCDVKSNVINPQLFNEIAKHCRKNPSIV
jgi:Ran GTPase-activating protein (RanGAP) involved in mRNA processing and transport